MANLPQTLANRVLFTLQVPGRNAPSTVISFAQKTFNNGQLTSKLHVIELGATAGGPWLRIAVSGAVAC